MERRVLMALLVALIVIVSSVAAGVILLGKGNEPRPLSAGTARAWVDLTSLSSGEVRERDRWGSVETFSGAKLGTLNYYKQASFSQSPATESVVLDGAVWCMVRSNTSNTVLLRYSPQVSGPSWNVSYECYAPQANNYFDPAVGVQHIGLTATIVDVTGRPLASVDMAYGTPGEDHVMVSDPGMGTTKVLSEDILSAYTNRGGDEGTAPDRYIVSFQRLEGGPCVVTVMHTSGGLIGQTAIDVPSDWSGLAQLVLSTTSVVQMRYGVDPAVPWSPVVYTGAWVIDNLACRGATARYPLAGPAYEYAVEGGRAPGPNSTRGSEQVGASVTIDGRQASFNTSSGRYEADLKMDVQWGKKVNYAVTMDGVTLNDQMSLTMVSKAPHAALTQWWNGWDWVTVFGEDDCSGPSTILDKYVGYDHPLTAYCLSSGDSSDMTLVSPYVEIALHYPHDWEFGNRKFWNDAVSQANSGVDLLRSSYEYASRWDAPANGGKGDTYISMANPGNKATYQLIYALYNAGVRVDGRTSEVEAGAPGNNTHIGSWYYPGGYMGTGAGWYPYNPMDLMDAARSLSWDVSRSWNSTFALVDSVAQNHGVLRIYGHPGQSIKIPEVLHWMDDDKSNYSLENWKATDGEVASYIYGRWSTSLRFDAQGSSDSSWKYEVSSKDPAAAGYWKVPVTVAIDLGGRAVKDVIVHQGSKDLKMSDGTLHDLNGKRIMDMGFDVRNGTLYVSEMWNSSSTLTIIFEPGTSSTSMTNVTSPLMMRDP